MTVKEVRWLWRRHGRVVDVDGHRLVRYLGVVRSLEEVNHGAETTAECDAETESDRSRDGEISYCVDPEYEHSERYRSGADVADDDSEAPESSGRRGAVTGGVVHPTSESTGHELTFFETPPGDKTYASLRPTGGTCPPAQTDVGMS
ncbi:hypothetical protein GCM10009030_18590 [Haloarcula pellucida]|uniref:Uncharacterized protein n=1 Tax=Haloarcula pellucida TaxID=1427151 RepID=A0A830GLA0_9EURY|nr:hypothetical protein GCM10009030_18590 [Halomicroarcula pellucida]